METRYPPPRGFSRAGVPSSISTDDGHARSRGQRVSPPSPSSPMAMSIPGSNSYDEPPPPLPPPRFPPVDGLQTYHNKFRDPEESFFGEDREGYNKLSHRSSRHDPDEGYHSIGSARALNSPQFSMHNGYQFRPRADADSSMLNKLNARRPLDNRSPPRWSTLSSSARDSTAHRPVPMQLPKLLSLPDRTRGYQPVLGSPDRQTQTPMVSAVSPRSNPFGHGISRLGGDFRSPLSANSNESDRSPFPRSRRINSESMQDDAGTATHGSYDTREDDIDFPMEETSRLHLLNIDDAGRDKDRDRGQKRRASSPLEDHVLPLPSDMFRRRDVGLSRGSPTPRLTPIAQSSLSSISTAARSATSYQSLTSASSMTSVGSFGRRSPNGPSPTSPTDTAGYESPYMTPASLGEISRRSSISRTVAAVQQSHQRNLSDIPALPGSRSLLTGRIASEAPLPRNTGSSLAAKLQGFFMCECCPKKPKKFETRDELSAHEAEKQYECSFCGNRFKNKNEAERHQNSLHVRRHSWSCSALTAYERVFHDSTTHPGEADICGYCGEEFLRTAFAGSVRFISEADWEVRVQHLQDIHKFGECNASKKFYRADHFRQHLKHSHAGTSGKWTNMLENACMIEEDPPMPLR